MRRLCRISPILAAIFWLAACGSSGSKSVAAPSTTAPSTTAPGGNGSSTAGTTSGSTFASSTTVAGASGPETNVAGDIPDTQPFTDYMPPDNLYTVKVPEGWARKESAARATLTDKLNAIDIVVSAAATAPTVESVRSGEISPLASTTPCFQLVNVVNVARKAGNAVLVTYRADSAPDPVTSKVVRDDVERYEFWKGGKEVTLTLSAPAGSDNVDPWKVVTDSFAWR